MLSYNYYVNKQSTQLSVLVYVCPSSVTSNDIFEVRRPLVLSSDYYVNK